MEPVYAELVSRNPTVVAASTTQEVDTVPSNTAVSLAPGTPTMPGLYQLPESDQLFVAPPPVHVYELRTIRGSSDSGPDTLRGVRFRAGLFDQRLRFAEALLPERSPFRSKIDNQFIHSHWSSSGAGAITLPGWTIRYQRNDSCGTRIGDNNRIRQTAFRAPPRCGSRRHSSLAKQHSRRERPASCRRERPRQEEATDHQQRKPGQQGLGGFLRRTRRSTTTRQEFARPEW